MPLDLLQLCQPDFELGRMPKAHRGRQRQVIDGRRLQLEKQREVVKAFERERESVLAQANALQPLHKRTLLRQRLLPSARASRCDRILPPPDRPAQPRRLSAARRLAELVAMRPCSLRGDRPRVATAVTPGRYRSNTLQLLPDCVLEEPLAPLQRQIEGSRLATQRRRWRSSISGRGRRLRLLQQLVQLLLLPQVLLAQCLNDPVLRG